MKSLVMTIVALISVPCLAGVIAYSGDAGEKMFIEAAPSLGKEVYLLKFEGPTSEWAGKVIKVKKEAGTDGMDRYSFEYDLELSTGIQKKTYGIASEKGYELIEGSRVKTIGLYYNGMPDHRKPLKFNQDRKLTAESQQIKLEAQFKKTPYKPDPE